MAIAHSFDTLGYAKTLKARGFTSEQAEALAEANHEFLINDLVTKDFVRSEVQSLKIWIGSVAVVMTGVVATLIKLL